MTNQPEIHKPKSSQGVLLFLGLAVIGVSLGFAGFKLYEGLKQFRSYDRFVTVKGLATKDVRADLAVWTVNFTATGNDLSAAQLSLETNAGKVRAFLKANGMTDENIRLQNITVADKQAQTYGGDTSGERYVLSQAFLVRTNTIDSMVTLSQKITDLVKDGIVLGQPNGGYNPPPQYIFTKLNDIKPEMIAEATQNARLSAEQFAKDTDQDIGDIRRANQGIFEILTRDPSVNESETPDKTVRLVSTLDYYLGE